MFGRLLGPILESVLGEGHVYTNTFSESGKAPPVTPAARMSLASSVGATTNKGTNDENTDDLRIQVDIVDDTYSGMQSTRIAVIAALRADVSRVWQRGGITETFDSATKLHRCYFDVQLAQSGS